MRCSHGKRLYAQLLSLASVAHGLTVQPLTVSHHHEQRRLVRQQVRVAGATGPTAAVAATAVGGTFVRVYRAGKQCFQSAAVVGGGAEPHWDESAFVPVGGYGDALRQPIRVELCVRGSAGGEEAVAFGEVSIETLGFGECREVSCCCYHRPLLSLVSTLMWLPALPRVVRRCRLCDPLRAQVPLVYITRRAPSALCVHHTACSIALCEHHMACSECSFQLAMIGCVHLRPQVNLSLEALVAGHPAPLPGQPPASLQMFLELGRRGIPPAWKPAPVGGTTQEESVRRELTSRYITPLTRRLAHTCVGCHAWPHLGVSWRSLAWPHVGVS